MGNDGIVGYFITWAQLHYFWTLGIALLGIVCVGIYLVRAYHALKILAVSNYRPIVLRGYSPLFFFIRLFLAMGVFIMLWLAILRPQYPLGVPTTHYEYGRDVVIAVDISRSMLVAGETGIAHNNEMTRIMRARAIIDSILNKITSERLALIAFSGAALTLCPLTKDISAFRMFLDLLSPGILSGGGTTALSSALREAMLLFSQQGERGHKLLVIITDGEDFSPDLAEVQKSAEEMGINISIIGIGTEAGGPIPCFNGKGEKTGYQRDENGIVISRLNETLLRDIAHKFKGLYLSALLSDSNVRDKLLAWVRTKEAERGASYEVDSRGDLFMWCIAVALVILLIIGV